MKTNHPDLWLHLWPRLDSQSHKYTRGHAMIIGGKSMTGAARLAAMAAARSGSGLTTLLVPSLSFNIYATAMLSVIVNPYTELVTFQNHINNNKVSSLLIGPGFGLDQENLAFIKACLATQKPVVLDADAISAFEGQLNSLREAINGPVVITPHEGEFKRLFTLESDRSYSAIHASKTINAVVVLKGAETIIAAPDGRVIINRNAPPSLATGGSGDVLAGITTGLLAQGLPAFEAAAAANWFHTQAALKFGTGLIAEDLPNMMPSVLKDLFD